MAGRMWKAKETQKIIRALRNAGYTVERKNGMTYTLDFEGERLFTALRFSWGYAVTYDERLFQGEEEEQVT